ncbi:MAG: hypothetical protein ACYC01_00575 [Lutibacter sp.]
MPIKILFIEENDINQEAIKLCLKQNSYIQFDIIDDLNGLDAALKLSNFTHLVAQSNVKNEIVIAFSNLNQLPVLIMNDSELDLKETFYTSAKSPLSYPELFSFLVKSTHISYASIDEYAMGDEEFFEQIKALMVDEFKHNLEEIPRLIETNNLSELKSRAHQMSSKFAMLDIQQSALLCKEVDVNILNDTENQLENMKVLLVDIEIALAHLQ